MEHLNLRFWQGMHLISAEPPSHHLFVFLHCLHLSFGSCVPRGTFPLKEHLYPLIEQFLQVLESSVR